MHLYFGSFSLALLENRRNNAVTKARIGRELLNLIDADYAIGKEDRYIYYFMDGQRELPKELKFRMADTSVLENAFACFIERYISPDHARLLCDLVALITKDEALPVQTKEHLLLRSDTLELPAFLAELFIFTVDSTNNKSTGIKPRAHKKRLNLQKRIDRTANNKTLLNLAKIAIQEKDEKALAAVFDKMTSDLYVADLLVFLAQDEGFANSPDYMEKFHSAFSKVENNIYRVKVFSECLIAGFFRDNSEQLLEPHMREYTNNRYTYEILVLLYEIGQTVQAERYRELLTNKVYIKRMNALLAGTP